MKRGQVSNSLMLAAALVLATATCAHERFCRTTEEDYPNEPFVLSVKPSAAQALIGGRLHVVYTLTNVATVPVAACARSWADYHFIGQAGNRGMITVTADGIPLDDVIRVAPGTSLVWERDVLVPQVGEGPAEFIGIFHSNCWLWSGTVKSKPVEVRLVASE